MSRVFVLVLSLSLSGSLLALVLFALKPLLKNKLSKTWQYYIWLVVVLRMLVPFTPEASIVGAVFTRAGTELVSTQPAPSAQAPAAKTEPALEPPQGEESPAPQAAAPSPWTGLKENLWLFWLGIAVILLVQKATSYHSFLRFIKAGRFPVTDQAVLQVYRRMCAERGVRQAPPLYTNKLAVSPMLAGLFRPFLVLPQTELTEEQLCYVFAHELTHFTRLDIFYKWLTQLAVCLHWFNPLVYLISNEVNRGCELSCDESVIQALDKQEKQRYGDTLIAAIKSGGGYADHIVSITLNENLNLLKERLGAIMEFSKKSKWVAAVSVVLTLALCGCAVAAGAYTAPPKSAPKVQMVEKSESVAPGGGSQAAEAPAAAEEGSPEQAVEMAFKALQTADIDTFNQYSDNQTNTGITIFGDQNSIANTHIFGGYRMDARTREIMTELFGKLRWTVGEVTPDGERATVSVRVTNTDFTEVMAETARRSEADQDDDTALVMRSMDDSIERTTEVPLVLNKTDGCWQVHIDLPLLGALTGGMFSDEADERFRIVMEDSMKRAMEDITLPEPPKLPEFDAAKFADYFKGFDEAFADVNGTDAAAYNGNSAGDAALIAIANKAMANDAEFEKKRISTSIVAGDASDFVARFVLEKGYSKGEQWEIRLKKRNADGTMSPWYYHNKDGKLVEVTDFIELENRTDYVLIANGSEVKTEGLA